MIERIAQDKAAEIVRHFVTGHTYNFDFDNAQPESSDPIIDAIWDMDKAHNKQLSSLLSSMGRFTLWFSLPGRAALKNLRRSR